MPAICRITPVSYGLRRRCGSLIAPTALSGDQPATVQDVPFEFDIPCVATAGSVGAACSVTTTADAVTPGIVSEGARASWRLSQLQVFDGGADGDPDTADNTVFARQGLFVP